MVSIGEFLDAFGFENMLLIATFMISFVFLNFILNRVFKRQFKEPNPKASGIISFALSMIIVYGINTLDFDLGSFLFDIGLGGDVLILVITLAIIVGILYLIWKIGRILFLILAGLLIIVSFTDWVYEKEIILFTGIGFFILWIILVLLKKKPGKPKISNNSKYIRPELEKARKREHSNGTIKPTMKQLKAQTRQEDWARRIEIKRAKQEAEEKKKQEERKQTELAKQIQYEEDQAERRKRAAQQEAEDRERQEQEKQMQIRNKEAQRIRDQLIQIQTKMQRIVDRLTPIEKQYQKMEAPLQELGNEAGRLGWTKGGLTEIPGETPEQREARAKAARDAYKKWIKELNKRDALRKEINQLRAEHEALTPKYNKLNQQYLKLAS